MRLSPKNFEKVVFASCVLHNILLEKSPLHYTPPGSFDNEDIDSGKYYLEIGDQMMVQMQCSQ